MALDVVAATGDLLEEILDETYPMWGEGLERGAYSKYNQAQLATPWGATHLRRVALVDGIGRTKGQRAEALVQLVDRYDEKTGFTAMQRLTGWHGSILLIAAVNNMVRRGAGSVELALPGKTIVTECKRRGFSMTETGTVGI